jgi:type IV pilus assembly protein PilN
MVRINLLPVRVSKKKEAGTQQLVLFAVLLVAGLIGNYLWASARGRDLSQREAKVARTREDIAQLDRIIGEVKNIKEAQQALRQKLDVLQKLKQARTGPVRMLDELATVTPRQLWLSKMAEKGGEVSFSGVAMTIDDVSELMAKLQGSKYFSRVELKKTSASADRKAARLVNFEINATTSYNPLAAEAAKASGGPPAPAPAPAPAPVADGSVLLGITPWGEIVVDGASHGVSPPLTKLTLPAGVHTIEVRNGSTPAYIARIDLQPGQSVEIKHRF